MADDIDFQLNPESDAFGARLASLGNGTFVNQTPKFGLPLPPPLPAPGKLPVSVPAARPVASAPETAGTPDPAVRDYIAERLAKKDDELKGLQEQAATDRRGAGVTEGVGQIIAGLSRSSQPFNPAGYQFLQEGAKVPVQDYLQRADARSKAVGEMSAEQKYSREASLEDPNSVQSTVARNVAQRELTKYGADPKMVDGMSAADVKEFMDKTLGRMETSASREQIAKIHHEDMALRRKEMEGRQNEQMLIRATNNANRRLEGNPTIKNGFNRIDKVNNAEHVIDAIESGELTDSESISAQLTSMITNIELGSGGSLSDREHTAIKSLQGKVANLKSYITGNPGGAIPAPMLAQVKNEIAVLKRGTLQNMDKARRSLVAGTSVKSEQDAINGRIDSYLQEHGYDPAEDSKKSHAGGKQSGSKHPQDEQALAWAKSNPTDPRAKKILELNGGGPDGL